MTREKAIETAVRRWIKASVGDLNDAGVKTFVHLCEMGIMKRQWGYERDLKAIRAHYWDVCWQYGVSNAVTISPPYCPTNNDYIMTYV